MEVLEKNSQRKRRPAKRARCCTHESRKIMRVKKDEVYVRIVGH